MHDVYRNDICACEHTSILYATEHACNSYYYINFKGVKQSKRKSMFLCTLGKVFYSTQVS